MRRYLASFATRETMGQFIRMAVIGVFNTVTYFALFNLFRFAVGWTTFWSVTGCFRHRHRVFLCAQPALDLPSRPQHRVLG